jgi:hypothetical protein
MLVKEYLCAVRPRCWMSAGCLVRLGCDVEQDEAVQTETRKTIGQIRRLRKDEASKSMQKTSLTGFVCFCVSGKAQD